MGFFYSNSENYSNQLVIGCVFGSVVDKMNFHIPQRLLSITTKVNFIDSVQGYYTTLRDL